MEEKRVIELLESVLDRRNRIDAETHSTHHAFVEQLIKEREEQRERIEKIKSHVLGWGVITAVTGIGYALWEFIKAHLK